MGRGARSQKGRYLRLVLTGCILPADLVNSIGPLVTEMCCMGLQIHKQASMAYVVCIRWLSMHVSSYTMLFMSKWFSPTPLLQRHTALVFFNSFPISTTKTSRLPTHPHPVHRLALVAAYASRGRRAKRAGEARHEAP